VRRRIEIAWAQEASAAPVTVGDVTVTPRARALVVRLPQGGFVWNRPTAVTVERAGAARHLPVVDVIRLLQLGTARPRSGDRRHRPQAVRRTEVTA